MLVGCGRNHTSNTSREVVLVASLKPLIWALRPSWLPALPSQCIVDNSEAKCLQPWTAVLALGIVNVNP